MNVIRRQSTILVFKGIIIKKTKYVFQLEMKENECENSIIHWHLMLSDILKKKQNNK